MPLLLLQERKWRFERCFDFTGLHRWFGSGPGLDSVHVSNLCSDIITTEKRRYKLRIPRVGDRVVMTPQCLRNRDYTLKTNE